jgi:hypothetical protein
MSGFGGGGGGGFGQPPPFGSAPTGFGNSGGFGSSNNNSQQCLPAPFGTSTSAPASGMSFGSSPNVMTPAPSHGFGQVAPSGGGFGQSQQQSTSFASSSFGASPGNNVGVGFHHHHKQQSTLNASANPFVPGQSVATHSAPTGGTMFGSSSNVVTDSSGAGGFRPASSASSWGRPGNNPGFGSLKSGFGSGFGGNSSSGFGGGNSSSQSTNNKPFVTSNSSNQSFHSTSFGNGFSSFHQNQNYGPSDDEMEGGQRPGFKSQGNDDAGSLFPFGGRPPKSLSKMSAVHEEGAAAAADHDHDDDEGNEAKLKAKIEEKKRLLQAKIEEKKRRLAEKQKRKPKQDEGGDDRSRTPTPTRDMNKSLAERNAQRFGQDNQQNTVSRHMLPEDIRHSQQQHPSSFSSSNPVPESGRADLDKAVSLVGLCRYMCPDEELIRRQQENDVQALEIPLPGKLHPEGWTLRDTAVKRFRRSAADYKLDVPEWVRPPDVLERTISYCEEYIMERDRQGPDPRFPQGCTPPPLDVYQFIWDRTRMIRKDFILQNYVGTGGLCDARAVRCHERIARWHAMCEHQLSHIPDFITMQSQQNIQELGQTMKTLNHFYDDSLNRSTIEVPDDKGIETRVAADLSKYNQGCVSEIVMGKNPVDYDGNALNNSPDNPSNSLRLIGKGAVNLPAHGTAEPEMRALYILLTMDNEGGMEVLKYAAKLFKERPAVYQSKPVQRAMEVFKSKKELNYVRFFSLLRSRSTPYLFCCIMFKHVELMRKIAFRIMSRTYGAMNKDTGETFYDQYPLDRLVKLLCFEDISEAREACKFYNITVKQRRSQNGDVKEIIYWRATKFKEPQHPEKGHTLRLQPEKMIRTIESKLNGATRLAVCRGQVSGEGAGLSVPVVTSGSDVQAISLVPFNGDAQALATSRSISSVEESEAKAQALLIKQKIERARQEKLMKQNEQKELRAQEIKEKQQAEQRRLEIEEQQRREIEKEHQDQMIKAELQRQQEELARQRQEAEKARLIAEETARKKASEEERIRQQKQQEEQRIKEVAARKEQERQHLLAEEMRKKALEEERRREEEHARQRRLQRLEQEARRKREAEEQRKAKEWQDKIDSANKLILWKRWRRALSRPLEMSLGAQGTIREIDTICNETSIKIVSRSDRIERHHAIHVSRPSTRGAIEQLLLLSPSKLSLATMTLREIVSLSSVTLCRDSGWQQPAKSTYLFKVAVVIPETEEAADESFANLIYQWINSCLVLGSVDTASGFLQHSTCEVRAIVVRGLTHEVCKTADVALIIVPPLWSDHSQKLGLLSHKVSSVIDDDIPRVALVLSDINDGERTKAENDEAIGSALQGILGKIPILRPAALSPQALISSLEFAVKRASKIFVHEACVLMSRVSTMQIAAKAITSVLRQFLPVSVCPEDEDTIIECSRITLEVAVQELAEQFIHKKHMWMLWPPPEFASGPGTGVVDSYFASGADLPLEWASLLSWKSLKEEYGSFFNAFRGHFGDVFQRILLKAPTVVQDDCAYYCAQGQYRQCLQKSLTWLQDSASSQGPFLYLPEGFLDSVIEIVVQKALSLMPLSCFSDNVSVVSIEKTPEHEYQSLDNDITDKEPIITTDAIGVASSSNKRRRPSSPIRDNVDDGEKRRKEDPAVLTKPRSASMKESDEFSRKLERLLQGETIDLDVGDTSLSRLLRGVPRMEL